MSTQIELNIIATSVEDLKRQIKAVYEELSDLEVATPKPPSTKAKYQEEIAELTRAAMAEKKKNLKKYTSAVFGWDVDKDDNLHPNWEEQDKITLMRDWYNKQGSYSAVAKRAKEAGWKGKKGGEWSSALVKRTLNYDLHSRVDEFHRPVDGVSLQNMQGKPAKKKGRRKNAPFAGPCKECGVTTTPQWRYKNEPFGPLCNACAMARKRKAAKATSTKGKPRSHEDRKKQRRIDISNNIKRTKKKNMTPETVEKKPQPVVQPDTSDSSFKSWLKTDLGPSILRNKQFLLASAMVETWYTSIQPRESYGNWFNNEGASKMAIMKEVFEHYQNAAPTIFIIQDTGDNTVLVITSMKQLSVKLIADISTPKSWSNE